MHDDSYWLRLYYNVNLLEGENYELKKIVTSLIFMLTTIILCSTYSYAATDNSDIKKDLEQNLSKSEDVFSGERSHYNLEDNDVITNNLELGDIYKVNRLNSDNDVDTNALSKNLISTDNYVSTIKLKDSKKPIALAYIKQKNSNWTIYRINRWNSLDDEIKDYKENVDENPIVIINEDCGLYAIGSEKQGDNIKIINKSPQLDLNEGDFQKISQLQPKIKK